MSLKIILIIVATLPACALEGTCETVEQTGPGLTGSMSYTTGDGSTASATLGGAMDISGREEITLHGTFDDSFGRRRAYDLHVRGIAIGMFELDGRGDVCFARQTGGSIVCSPLTGTIDVRQFDYDCYQHSSGVGTCAETLELTLHARSIWETTTFVLDAEMLSVGAWVDTECE